VDATEEELPVLQKRLVDEKQEELRTQLMADFLLDLRRPDGKDKNEKSKETQGLEGSWHYGNNEDSRRMYKLVANASDYIFEEVHSDGKISGPMRQEGDWYQGNVFQNGEHKGFMRLQLRKDAIVSNFKPRGSDAWRRDIIAHQADERKELPEPAVRKGEVRKGACGGA